MKKKRNSKLILQAKRNGREKLAKLRLKQYEKRDKTIGYALSIWILGIFLPCILALFLYTP